MATRRASRSADFPSMFEAVVSAVERAVQGKREPVRLSVVCLLAEGHLLIEDVPGVGKTLLAKSLARAVGCSWSRVQFTPDLLPTDVTGTSVFDQVRRSFEFRPGAIFANVVLGDEINRAPPKTQAAMLEAMEERQVTADGVAHELELPFMVIATQNPLEHEGTYPLPFAQLDRFMMRLSLGYPDAAAEDEMLVAHGMGSALEEVDAVCDARTVRAMINVARGIHVADALRQYVVELATATRSSPELSLGASPRASLALVRASRALAAADGRDYVTPDDIKQLAPAVLAHRLALSPEAEMGGRSPGDVLAAVLERVPVPVRR